MFFSQFQSKFKPANEAIIREKYCSFAEIVRLVRQTNMIKNSWPRTWLHAVGRVHLINTTLRPLACIVPHMIAPPSYKQIRLICRGLFSCDFDITTLLNEINDDWTRLLIKGMDGWMDASSNVQSPYVHISK